MTQYLLYLSYMLAGTLLAAVFSIVYLRFTPVRELRQIQQGNVACALSFGGALIGFCIALVSAMTHSLGIGNFIAWGIGAAVVQIGVYLAASKIISNVSAELERGNVAVGTLCCAMPVAIGLLNAACLVD